MSRCWRARLWASRALVTPYLVAWMWMGTTTQTCSRAPWLILLCCSGEPPGHQTLCSSDLIPVSHLVLQSIPSLARSPFLPNGLSMPRARPVLHVSQEMFIAPRAIDLEQPNCAGGRLVW